MRELIQAGPLLVENGRTVGGLESTKSSVRSVILWDGGTRWWIGCSTPCTLAALGQTLASGEPAGWPVRQALNLDGGRSSDFGSPVRFQEGRLCAARLGTARSGISSCSSQNDNRVTFSTENERWTQRDAVIGSLPPPV